MATFIKAHIAKGNKIIILIDANSNVRDRSVTNFLHDTGLFDLIEAFLPENPPSTYQRGCQKIDHIWGMPGIVTATINSGVLPFGISPNSDHAILYIDLSFDILTGLSSQSLRNPKHPSFRNLWSTDIKAAEKYIELVHTGFVSENIIKRTAILISRCQCANKCTPDDERILNKIDKTITRILLQAEKD